MASYCRRLRCAAPRRAGLFRNLKICAASTTRSHGASLHGQGLDHLEACGAAGRAQADHHSGDGPTIRKMSEQLGGWR